VPFRLNFLESFFLSVVSLTYLPSSLSSKHFRVEKTSYVSLLASHCNTKCDNLQIGVTYSIPFEKFKVTKIEKIK